MEGLPDRRVQDDPQLMRVSDADRNRVAEVLREAAGEGRLDLTELDQRLDAAFSAKVYADLIPLTADLPAVPVTATPARPTGRQVAPADTAWNSSMAVMGECARRGAWQVEETHTAFALMGSVQLDLREASFSAARTVITATAIMGEVKIVVDAFTKVEVNGVPIMGEFSQGKAKVAAQLGPDSPTVQVRGMALMGSVTVVRHPAPGTPKRYLGTY